MQAQQGPLMIVATEALSAPKVRIGHIGGNFTLPRTVPLASLVAGGVGAFIGILVSLIFGLGIKGLMYGTIIGGIAGVLVVTYSPLKGESLSRWLGLRLRARRQSIKLEGGVVQLAVGVALLKSATLGEVHLVPGAVNVPPSQYDERGAPLNHDDILRSILEDTGTIDMAETVMTGAVDLAEVESRPASYPPLRRRSRPTATELPPRTLPRPPARPMRAPFSPDISEILPDQLPLSAEPISPEHVGTTATPTTITPVEELSTAELVPDLPDPEGLTDWVAPPTPSLDALFAAPLAGADEAPHPDPTNETFAHVEKKVATSGWVVATDDPTPPGWTRPGQ